MTTAKKLAYIDVNGCARRILVPVKSIWISRAEGPSALCREWTFASWHDASWQLMINSKTAPKGGAYDKHDFLVTWATGDEYSGRFDLQHEMQWPKIEEHIRSFLGWLIENKSMPEATEAAAMLDVLDIGQVPPVVDPDGFEIVRDYRQHPARPFEGSIIQAGAYGIPIPDDHMKAFQDA